MNNKSLNNEITLQNDPDKNEDVPKKPKDLQPKIKNSKEVGGRQQGLEPTRYGDWEFKGRCIDF